MWKWLNWFLVAGLNLAGGDLFAAAKTEVRLVLSAETAGPGQTVLAGVLLRMPPGWHTYWRNSGESGAPTTIAWTLPSGVSAGPIQWPVPEKLTDADLTTYILQPEALLIVPLNLAGNLASGPLELRAKVSWLECARLCVPGETKLKATLLIGPQTAHGTNAALFAAWQSRLPKRDSNLVVRATWDAPPAAAERAVIVEWTAAGVPPFSDFYPYPGDGYEVQPSVQTLPTDAGKARLRLVVKKNGDTWPKQIAGILVAASTKARPQPAPAAKTDWGTDLLADKPSQAGATISAALSAAPAAAPDSSAVAYEVSLGLAASPSAGAGNPELPGQPLLLMLLYAFIGGLILNVMPCVLPVIALKILSFVNQSKESPREVRRLGLTYAAGVMLSFLGLAGVVITVKLAGHKAGWGMQLGNPQFVLGLMVLVTLVALNLFGLFEVNPGGKVLGVAGELSAKEGRAGAFFNGVLATILATPCTAPFLGAALGFAFAQPPPVIVLVFLTVGLGLSAPYVILSWQPAWLKYLPKPGVWMVKFKIAMGFPMLGTAVWLFSLLPRYYGRKTALWLGLFLVIVSLAAWLYGEFVQRGRHHKGLAALVALVLLVSGYGYALERQLHWRTPRADSDASASLKEDPDGIDWQPWSLAAVEQARAVGRPVFVDFTADWCFTCQANKKLSIEIPSVRAKLKAINAVALLGDYTTLPPSITEELTRHNRAGVPLVLVYPKTPTQPPIVLPEVLTPQRVLDALTLAAK